MGDSLPKVSGNDRLSGSSPTTAQQTRSAQAPTLPGAVAGAQPSASTLSPAQLELQAKARQRTEAMLRDLWKRKLPVVRDQIRTLERALAIIDSATLTAPLRVDAAMVAHKLAGSLGMFGYHEGTRIARELESRLDSDQPLSRPVYADLLQQLVASLHL